MVAVDDPKKVKRSEIAVNWGQYQVSEILIVWIYDIYILMIYCWIIALRFLRMLDYTTKCFNSDYKVKNCFKIGSMLVFSVTVNGRMDMIHRLKICTCETHWIAVMVNRCIEHSFW